MKGGKKPGFGGFGSAMFAINDIQSIYGNIDPKIQQPKKPSEVKPKQPIHQTKTPINSVKKIVPLQKTQKPKIILKPSTANHNPHKANPFPVNKAPTQPAKKQPPSQFNKQLLNTKIQQLSNIQVADSTFELTLSKKSTEWGYHIFQQEGKNANQIVPMPQISFSLHERNIRQGSIGNCYFICSLAALTKNIQVLRKRIPDFEKYNPLSESFKVNMFQSGKLVQINVLNSFEQSFSKPIENDITSMILQKAYAQLYGNYEIINMGHSIDSFRDLSGHIAQYIDLKNKTNSTKQIIDAFEMNHAMVIASKVKPEDELISGKHSYNILSYSYKNKHLFLELRDPRGWTKAMFNVPDYLESQAENGQFWIGYDDLVKNFQVITVSRYMPKSMYYYRTFGVKDLPTNGVKAIMFEVSSQSTIGFSIHQKHKKFFDKNHHYNVVNLMVCEVDKKGSPTKTLKANFNAQQVCSLTLELPKGVYAIIGQMHPFRATKQPYPEQIFTLSMSSSEQLLGFNDPSHFNLQNALTLYIQENLAEFKSLISPQNLHRHHGSLFGKMCILYQNNSGKSVIEELEFQTENIEVRDKKVTLDRDQVKLLMCPIGPANNCSHKCVFKSKTYYKK